MNINHYEDESLALESKLDKLCKLATSIENAGGMTKSFALEAIEVLPNFGNGTPLAYYTTMPSLSRQEVALEEVSNGILAIIAAGVAAIAVILYKFYRWLFPKKGDDDSNSETADISVTIETIDNIVETASEKTKVIKEIDNQLVIIQQNAKNSPAKKVNLNELIDSYIKGKGENSDLAKVLNETDPLMHDLMNNGEYSNEMKRSEGNIKSILSIVDMLSERYSLVSDAVKLIDTTVPHSGGGFLKTAFNSILEKLHLKSDTVKSIKLTNSKGSNLILKELADNMLAVRNKVSDNSKGGKIQFTVIDEKFANAIALSNISRLLKDIDKAESNLDKLRNTLELTNKAHYNLSKRDNGDTELTGLSKELATAFSDIKTDTISCIKFINIIVQYGRNIKAINGKVISAQHLALKVVDEYIKDINGSVPSELKDLQKRLIITFKLN
jgi:hypothetical protein